jgi:hypothetical protein
VINFCALALFAAAAAAAVDAADPDRAAAVEELNAVVAIFNIPF